MRFDYHIQIIDPSEQSFGANFTFDLGRPIKVDGLQKLVNRWLKIFCTPKGSHPVRRLEGTEFAYLYGSNQADVATLQPVIAEYCEDASNQVRSVDRRSPWLTSSEQLKSADLLQFNAINETSIEFWVQINNNAGERARILIPYAVNGVT